MASKAPGRDDPLPGSVIAQAEAACAGNAEEDHSEEQRRPSVARQVYSRFREEQLDNTVNPQKDATSAYRPPRFGDSNSFSVEGSTGSPPKYNDQFEISQDGFDTKAKVTDDGRVNISINQKTRKLSDLLVPALRSQLSLVAQEKEHPLPPGYIPPSLEGQPGQVPPPRLNVVIHVVGSRGDVQPFVALGKVLKSTYGHRVRLATHPTFQSFVEENGLEFFSIGGDPAELMAFMVKNPGLMPGFDSLKSGDVGKRRKGMEEIVLGCWRSCIEAGDGLGMRDDISGIERQSLEGGIKMSTNPAERPFIADAIIANPPSFAHVHIAEKLGIPLHMMFTMPWSPTQSFPHPLANIQSSNADVNMTNFISYALVEMMTWQGLGDIINRFRERVLGLEALSLIWAPGVLTRLRIPYTYCWSSALIPKPKDWGQHISVSGFFFLNLTSSYEPDPELVDFLASGPPPVYIGFGSIVVDDPSYMTALIFEAIKKTGVRALVSKGWGGLGGDALVIPEGVFMLGNVPHDWLFRHVSCVVHHGGAGTSAAGISLGRPTVVVPFFGDQTWWGAMIHRAGAGPAPIPYRQLTADKLGAAITEALKPATLVKAQELGARIIQENGTEVGAKSFHDHLDCSTLRCSLAPTRVAVWRVKRTQIRLSALAATVLANEGLLDFADLKLYRACEYETEDGPWDPISGGASALLGTIASLTMGVADFPVEVFKAFKSRPEEAVNDEPAAPHADGTSSVTENSLASSGLSTGDSAFRPQSPLNMVSVGKELARFPTSSTASTTLTSSDSEPGATLISAETPTSPPSAATRDGSLKQAVGGTLRHSGSPWQDWKPGSRPSSPFRKQAEKPFDPSTITLESAIGASKGLSRIVNAGLKSPMDFTLGLARGFHNAPKLYGDDTVRPQEKITDFQSGLKAAGKEFRYGLYDGISGLITQPMKGAEKEGTAGLIKGIGRGIGGLVLKPGAALWGLPGYTLMGIHKEVRKIFGSGVQNYIISARTAQGYEQWKNSTQEERLGIIHLWREMKSELQNTRQKIHDQGGLECQEPRRFSPRVLFQTRHLEPGKQKRTQEQGRTYGADTRLRCPVCDKKTAHEHNNDHSHEVPHDNDVHYIIESPAVDMDEFEHAIQASVKSTSRGNPDEDMVIERAIRASVQELQAHHDTTLSEQESLNRAIQASIAEAKRSNLVGTTDGDRIGLEDSIQRSLAQSMGMSSIVPVDDDDDDEEFKRAIEESRIHHEQQLSRTRTDEDIVLEYVKKQSLAEEEFKKAMKTKQGAFSGSEHDHDDDRKTAIEESKKTSGSF